MNINFDRLRGLPEALGQTREVSLAALNLLNPRPLAQSIRQTFSREDPSRRKLFATIIGVAAGLPITSALAQSSSTGSLEGGVAQIAVPVAPVLPVYPATDGITPNANEAPISPEVLLPPPPLPEFSWDLAGIDGGKHFIAKAPDGQKNALSTWGYQILNKQISDAYAASGNLGQATSNEFNGTQTFEHGAIKIVNGSAQVLDEVTAASIVVPKDAKNITPPPPTPPEILTSPDSFDTTFVIGKDARIVIHNGPDTGLVITDLDRAQDAANLLGNDNSKDSTFTEFFADRLALQVSLNPRGQWTDQILAMKSALDPQRTMEVYPTSVNDNLAGMSMMLGFSNNDVVLINNILHPENFRQSNYIFFPVADLAQYGAPYRSPFFENNIRNTPAYSSPPAEWLKPTLLSLLQNPNTAKLIYRQPILANPQ